MIWLKIFSVFSSLDNVFVSIAQSQKIEKPETSDTTSIKNDTVVLQIDDETWKTHFNQQSPLRRDYLAKIIACLMEIDKPHPIRLIVIDLDLSPGQIELSGEKSKALTVDIDAETNTVCNNKDKQHQESPGINLQDLPISKDQLVEAQHNLNNVVAKYGNKIILHKPSIQSKESEKIIEWMQNLSEYGVTFSSPNLYMHDGKLLKFDTKEANLATMAFYRLSEMDTKESNKDISVTEEYLSGNLNYHGFKDETDVINLKLNDSGRPDISFDKCKLEQGPVVFLGLNRKGNDQFFSPIGQISGVLGHAINYYSITNPIGKHKFYDYILEIIIGTFLGLSLHLIDHRLKDAKKVKKAKAAVAAKELTKEATKEATAAEIYYFVFRVLGILLPILCSLAIIYGFFFLLKSQNIWLSPIVFVVAIAVETQYSLWMKANRPHAHGESDNESTHFSSFVALKNYARRKKFKFTLITIINIGAISFVIADLL